MHPDEVAEFNELAVASEPPERRKLPDGVVLTFAIDETTGIQVFSHEKERALSKFTDIVYWADGVQVTGGNYRLIIETIQIGEKLSTFDDLHDQLAGLLKRYATPAQPEENSDGPTHA